MTMFPFATRVAVVCEVGLQPTLSILNNRLCRYGYRLLTAMRSQPKRDILPITLCKRKKQAKPEKLAAWDDD